MDDDDGVEEVGDVDDAGEEEESYDLEVEEEDVDVSDVYVRGEEEEEVELYDFYEDDIPSVGIFFVSDS